MEIPKQAEETGLQPVDLESLGIQFMTREPGQKQTMIFDGNCGKKAKITNAGTYGLRRE